MDATERRDRACAEAADWWTRMQAEDFSRAEREQFVDWLRESATHIAEMLRIARVHGELEQFQRWTKIAGGGPADRSEVIALPARMDSPPVSKARKRWAASHVGALAAGIALVCISAVLYLSTIRGQTIDTERGERREVALSDGSVVQVDPKTRLRVKFTDGSRQVFLERGRALFRVAKDPGRPFLVQADDTVVRVLGTAFGVDRQRQGVVVTVSEGKVAVSNALAARNTKAGATNEGVLQSGLALTANQQVTVRPSDPRLPVRKVDSGRELAWAHGRLIFENDSVSEVVEQFNRYNRVQLHVADAALAARPVSGVFSASDPESFIGFIQTVASVRIVRREGTDIVIQAGIRAAPH